MFQIILTKQGSPISLKNGAAIDPVFLSFGALLIGSLELGHQIYRCLEIIKVHN